MATGDNSIKIDGDEDILVAEYISDDETAAGATDVRDPEEDDDDDDKIDITKVDPHLISY